MILCSSSMCVISSRTGLPLLPGLHRVLRRIDGRGRRRRLVGSRLAADQGEQQARRLQANLDAASGNEQCRSLMRQILANLEEAISTAKLMDNATTSAASDAAAASNSPRSNSGSPRSDDSERVFKEHERREMCKKRKSLPKWTSQVRISGGSAGEGLEDGFSWRKYGQKEILGARHPRGYYRCTHRNSVGCLATKQVQRSDKDPCLFDISYRGEHTCLHKLLQAPPPAPPPPTGDEEKDLQEPPAGHPLIPAPPATCSTTCLPENFQLQETQLLPSSAFSFPSTSPLHCFAHEAQFFSGFAAPLESGDFLTGFSPPFISPTSITSDSNFLSLPPSSQMSSYGGGILPNTSESDLTEIISAATSNSTTNSPRMKATATFVMDHMDFDPVFPFDPSKFF